MSDKGMKYKITQTYRNAGKEEEDGTAVSFCHHGRI